MTTQPNKVAIVTGASRGIGAAVARRLARDGFTVAVNYANGEAAALALVREIEAAGGRAITARADVADPVAVSRMFDAAEAAFGGVDVLVNNAGIMPLKPIADSDDAFFDRLIAVNLKGTFNGLREAARRLRNGGRIVNFSTSVIGLRLETYGVYAATKSAVETLTAILSKELRGRSITVNAIAPGPTATHLFLDGKPQDLIDRMAKLNPLERLELLRELVPGAARIAVLVNPADAANTESTLRDVEAAARAIGLQIQVVRASTSREIDAAFATIARERLEALFVGNAPFLDVRRVQLVQLAARHVIPATYPRARIR